MIFNMEIKTKCHLNNLAIILGTKCNLKCSHCMGGNPKEKMVIQNKYIDDLIQNITGIDELSFIGYEITFYIKEIKMIFDKLLNAGIKINRFTMNTNAVIYSQQLTDLIKHYQKYVTYPDKVMIHFSDDIFHYHNGFNKEKMAKNAEKYIRELNNCQVAIQDFNKETETLVIQGRAENLDSSYIDRIKKVNIPITDNANFQVEFRPECKGKQNTCNNGNCVCNCIVSEIVMTPDGYIFVNDGMAFNAISTKNYIQSIGHISKMSLFEMVENQNNTYSERKDKTLFIRFKDEYAVDWYAQKVVYDYILSVKQIMQAINENDIEWYQELKSNINNEINKIPALIIKSNDAHAIEYANQILKCLQADYQALISVADSCFTLPFMKSLFVWQLELYRNTSPFNCDKFYNIVGINYTMFMDLWEHYYNCDFENYKNKSLQIVKFNNQYLKNNQQKTK